MSQFVQEKLGYLVEGSGPTVVLLHSSMSSKNQWHSLIKKMRDTNRVIAIDLLGYGQSNFPNRLAADKNFVLENEVDSIVATLSGLISAGESVHIVGHSYGGAVALRCAYQFPLRIKSLTLYEPVAFHLLSYGDSGLIHILSLVDTIESLLIRDKKFEATAHFVNFWRGEGAFDKLDDVQQMQSMRCLNKTILDFQALLSERATLEDYRHIEAPCCLIGGLQSQPVAHQVLARLSTMFGASRKMIWLPAGHMAPITNPDLVEPHIIDFIARIDANDDASSSASAVITHAEEAPQGRREAMPSEFGRISTERAVGELSLLPLASRLFSPIYF
jgi:pimeloyl-ACP methyl ester carboxylesterase